MRLVERHQIRRNHNLYKLCNELCFQSKNLYNAALYEYRQSFIDKNRKNLNWVEINKLFNNNNQYDYRQLPAKVSNLVTRLTTSSSIRGTHLITLPFLTG